MKILLAVVFLSVLVGCGPAGLNGNPGPAGPQGPSGAPGPTGPAASPSPSPDANTADIQDVLQNGAHGNAYRLGLGQTELSPGLSCQVQKVASGYWLSNSSPGYQSAQGTLVMTGTNYTYLYDGDFNQPSVTGSSPNALIPGPIQALFENVNYRIVCQGYMVVQAPGWTEFEDESDDGSIVYLDGATLYNDGSHGINTTPVTQSVYFDRDVHPFQVWYSQSAGGNFALILTENNAPIAGNLYFH